MDRTYICFNFGRLSSRYVQLGLQLDETNHLRSGLKVYAGANPRRRISTHKQGPILIHQKPGPLQMIFDLLPDEVIIPFGDIYEVHCRWTVVTTSESSCTIDVKVGVHFKKWCVMQSKIKSGAISEYKKEVELMLEVARSCINSKSNTVNDKTTHVVSSI